MKKASIFLAGWLTLIMVAGAYAEMERVEFKDPEPYTDYEFEELQRTFMKNRKVQLSTLKKLPLNQYPEEFLRDLIRQIKLEVKKEVQKEMLQYINQYLKKNKGVSSEILIKEDKKFQKDSNKEAIIRMQLDKDKQSDLEKNEKKKEKDKKKSDSIKDKNLITSEKGQGDDSEKNIEESNEEKQEKTVQSKDNKIMVFSLNNNTPFIGINTLSKIPFYGELVAAKDIKTFDFSIFVKNIDTGMIYLLKRTNESIDRKKSLNFMWEYPNIPFGKYKPYAIAKFYNASGDLVSQDFQYWGNSSSPKIYILFKN